MLAGCWVRRPGKCNDSRKVVGDYLKAILSNRRKPMKGYVMLKVVSSEI